MCFSLPIGTSLLLVFMAFTSLSRFLTFIHEYGHYLSYKLIDTSLNPTISIDYAKSNIFFVYGISHMLP